MNVKGKRNPRGSQEGLKTTIIIIQLIFVLHHLPLIKTRFSGQLSERESVRSREKARTHKLSERKLG